MGIIHFLNVNDGDCTLIKHATGHCSVIDVCNASSKEAVIKESFQLSGNHQQKKYPANPVDYFKDAGVDEIFRFILTHPDMDHMDGIKALFNEYSVLNFWDTDNNKELNSNDDWGKYNKEDWDFYQSIRESKKSPKALRLYSGERGQYFNQDENGNGGGDGLYILAPTEELVNEANETGDYNDCSYVLLYRTYGRKIIVSGDSGEKTWDYILENYESDVKDIDVLLAPHHGRKTGGNSEYLKVLKPKLTLFGNAKSKDLDYKSWNDLELEHITNNQANCIILDISSSDVIKVYVTYETFAKKMNPRAELKVVDGIDAWYIKTI